MCRPLNIDIFLQANKMSIDMLNFEGVPAPLYNLKGQDTNFESRILI